MLVLILLYGEKDLKRGKNNVSNQNLILLGFVYGQNESTQVPRVPHFTL